jgi:hypothetical protein
MIENAILIWLATWWFTHFEPLQTWLTKTIPADHPVWGVVLEVLSCWKCLSTWTLLVLTGSILFALAGGFLAWFTTKLLVKR